LFPTVAIDTYFYFATDGGSLGERVVVVARIKGWRDTGGAWMSK